MPRSTKLVFSVEPQNRHWKEVARESILSTWMVRLGGLTATVECSRNSTADGRLTSQRLGVPRISVRRSVRDVHCLWPDPMLRRAASQLLPAEAPVPLSPLPFHPKNRLLHVGLISKDPSEAVRGAIVVAIAVVGAQPSGRALVEPSIRAHGYCVLLRGGSRAERHVGLGHTSAQRC